ncbi:MAG: hypothetical protein HUU37_03265 [Bdellovibrionales bacterium]|nr:hypothetical protein [Bdellovibrionales bacterium]
MAEDQKPEILVLWRSGSSSAGVRPRLMKAVSAIAQAREVECSSAEEASPHLSSMPSTVLLDLTLLKTASQESWPTLCPSGSTVLAAQREEHEPNLAGFLAQRNYLELDAFAAPDLLRVLHLFLLPKRQAGITSLMEKGAVILAEKIQSLDHLGEIVDRAAQFFTDQLPDLVPLLGSFRQMALSLIQESFLKAQESGTPYPTVDFQLSGTREKIAFTTRMPLGATPFQEIVQAAHDARSLAWHMAWRHSSALLLVEHPEFREMEATSLLLLNGKSSLGAGGTLLSTSRSRSSTAENLLSAPKNYKFSLISELAHRRLDANKYTAASLKDIEAELADAQLPEKLRLRIQQMEQDRTNLQELIHSRETQMRDSQAQLNKARQELSQKRNEILRLMKDGEGSISKYKHRIADLESRLDYHAKELAAAKAKSANVPDTAAAKNLEGLVRTLEREKQVQEEKLVQEQKRAQLLEKKSAALFRDLGEKDKEIQNLKDALHKSEAAVASVTREPSVKQESKRGSVEAAMEAAKSTSNPNDPAAKLKETEARETTLKQEVRKLTLKVDTAEKNLKVVQTEAAEKAKLLERKLEAAKAKEIDLLKKVEELTALLKKATKAA